MRGLETAEDYCSISKYFYLFYLFITSAYFKSCGPTAVTVRTALRTTHVRHYIIAVYFVLLVGRHILELSGNNALIGKLLILLYYCVLTGRN